MMKKIFFILICVITLHSCNYDKSTNITSVNNFERDFEFKKSILKDNDNKFFSQLDSISDDSTAYTYLKYLFTYMPISDFADYDFNFFYRQVKVSIESQQFFSWASSIPQDIYFHYVLPIRANNENLDTARIYFYKELKHRLSDSITDIGVAALEINHWCHEKLNYRPTDERTISPMGAMLSTYGRCGEESTFAVTALRAAGIPARQVYTPRWAHTDDNHAWVEIWKDGKWYYLGACEPAPVLNTGWFDIPATRTMLVHTKEFGNTNQAQNFLNHTHNFNWVNALKTYAKTKTIFVAVVDKNNIPINNAEVQFQIYNYAEMFPLHKASTNFSGLVKFETGIGDIEVFVSYKDKFVSKQVLANDSNLIIIQIGDENILPQNSCIYTPPIAGQAKSIEIELEKQNQLRLKKEDSIRNEYEKTFYTKQKAAGFHKTFGYNELVNDYLINSRGNWQEIERFLIECSLNNNQKEAFNLLQVISEKDLRDTKCEILLEHLEESLKLDKQNLSDEIFNNYVLNPRIKSEMLKKYRRQILKDLDSALLIKIKSNPENIKEYLNKNIRTSLKHIDSSLFKISELNAYNVLISPSGVHKIKLADERSLKIYCVAILRTIGIPAKIDNTTNEIQYYLNNSWQDLLLNNENAKTEQTIKRTKLFLQSDDNKSDIKYRTNFAIAKIENAKINTVDLDWEIPISNFSNGIDLPIGKYMLLTSRRNEDGSVIVNREYFELSTNEVKIIKVKLPEMKSETVTNKKFSHNNIYNRQHNIINSQNITNNYKYTVFCWLDPAKEPSKHAVKDLMSVSKEFHDNNINLCFLVDDNKFNATDHGYPDNINVVFDKELNLLYSNISCKASNSKIIFPRIIMVDKDSFIICDIEGYSIAIGNLLLNKITK